MTSRLATDDEVETWKEHGWVLLEGLVDTGDIDAAAEDLHRAFPTADEYHADPDGATRRWLGTRKAIPRRSSSGRLKVPDSAVSSTVGGAPSFREMVPSTGLAVHPSIVDFAERALGTSDIRLYQAHASAKYAGLTNYEQPMHIDRNHSWLPAGAASPWWNLEGFLYLSDVSEDDNPTRMVSVRDSAHLTEATPVVMPDTDPPLYAVRGDGPAASAGPIWPIGPTSSTGAPRSTPRPRLGSSWPWPSSGPGRTGSATTRPSRSPPDRNGGLRRAVDTPGTGPLRVPAPRPSHLERVLLEQVALRYPRLDLAPWRARIPTD